MRRDVVGTLRAAVGLAVLGTGAWAHADVAAKPQAAPATAAAPGALVATTLDGKTIDIAAVPGYKVIEFFSVDCPCVRSCEALSFKPLALQYAGRVSFYAVTSGGWDLRDERANFTGLARTHDLPYPVVLDPSHAVADALGGQTASQAVLLGPDNHILYSGLADDSKDYKDATGKLGKTKSYLADAIAESLAAKPVTVPYTRPKGCTIGR